MIRFLSVAAALVGASVAPAAPPKPLAEGMKNPESVVVANGATYVTVIGEFDKNGDGAIVKIENGKVVPFTPNLNDPKGLAAYQKFLFVADKDTVWQIQPNGEAKMFASANAFPVPPKFLNDMVVDPESGTVYVSDSGDLKGSGGAVFRISPKGDVSLVLDQKRCPALHTPNGLAMDGASHLLLADFGSGALHRIKLADNSHEKVADGIGAGDGLVWDHFGRLFISDYKGGKLFAIPRPGDKPVLMMEGFKAAADICMDATGQSILVPDMTAGTLTAVPAVIPGYELDLSPLPVKTAVAFPNLTFTGWEKETADGKANPLRPIVLTHAGDGTNRVFVATQHGVIHVAPNDPAATKTEVFLDLQDRVTYSDKTNEEGFLGLVFHPKYKENGEFFVFYTPKNAKSRSNVVSRFRVSKDNPNKADAGSEEKLLVYENRPFWNHDGGAMAFGPDGFLYVSHGDGGAGNDPFDNGQNLNTWLGKILRIDVDHKDSGRNYAVPKDNPFVGNEKAKPEIFASGVRNVWRMSFDAKTGKLWGGEVGQNLFEEIILIEKGGNYGWNRREALHPFGARGKGPSKEFVEPVWEYHHDLGKSITGGHVYNGAKIPELAGHYVYADYVSSKLWALKYDAAKGRVVANRPIKDPQRAFLSFGEDEKGEVYMLTVTGGGKDGIHTFAK